MKELDADIEATKRVKDKHQKQKEAKIKQVWAAFDIDDLDLKREESFKTLRDLPVFGNKNAAIDFRYPAIENLKSMPKEKPIQAVEL